MIDSEQFRKGRVAVCRLLILSCSKAKSSNGGRIPALARYDGPAFRVLRRFISVSGDYTTVDILILSARYGFISPRKQIASYDQPMGLGGGPPAAKLLSQLTARTAGKRYAKVFINLGADYLSRLPDLPSILAGNPVIVLAEGRIGKRLHDMKAWLFDD